MTTACKTSFELFSFFDTYPNINENIRVFLPGFLNIILPNFDPFRFETGGSALPVHVLPFSSSFCLPFFITIPTGLDQELALPSYEEALRDKNRMQRSRSRSVVEDEQRRRRSRWWRWKWRRENEEEEEQEDGRGRRGAEVQLEEVESQSSQAPSSLSSSLSSSMAEMAVGEEPSPPPFEHALHL